MCFIFSTIYFPAITGQNWNTSEQLITTQQYRIMSRMVQIDYNRNRLYNMLKGLQKMLKTQETKC